MFVRYSCALTLAASLLFPSQLWAQGHQGPTAPTPRPGNNEDAAAVERGKIAFKSNCGFCHGEDATGSRAPDLVRSAILNHDEHGSLVAPVIKNGRIDRGMPAFSTLKDQQISDIVAFLHHQADAALHSAHVPGDYPLAKLLTGNAAAGKAFFEGSGGCTGCHSVGKDLAGIASKYQPVDLQQHMVYPSSKSAAKTAVVTTAGGQRYEGKIRDMDEFSIGLVCQDGWYRSWLLDQVKAEVKDPLQAHRELMGKYTDADVHNLFAYLETLK